MKFVNYCVLIITFAFNQPDFIRWQDALFKKFLKDEYEFVVFNDAKKEEMHAEINQVCKQLGIRCITVPQKLHKSIKKQKKKHLTVSSHRHSNALTYSLEQVGYKHDDIVAFVDSDLFLIHPFSFRDLMKECDVASMMRRAEGAEFCWPGFTVIAMNKIPDKTSFSLSCIDAKDQKCLDTGGKSWLYFLNHPQVRLKPVDTLYARQLFCPDEMLPFRDDADVKSITADPALPIPEQVAALKKMHFREIDIQFLLKKPSSIQYVCNNHFLHYRDGSQWTKTYESKFDDTFHQTKKQKTKEYIDSLLKLE
jgi:hypothetical protein